MMPAFRWHEHMLRGDELTVRIGGREIAKFVAGETLSFASTEEVEYFMAHSKEIFFKEYPCCFSCFGGSPVRKRGRVWAHGGRGCREGFVR